jgi:hypothetical protein
MAKCSESTAFNVTETLRLESSKGIEYNGDLSNLLKKMHKLRCLDIENLSIASDAGGESEGLEDGDSTYGRGAFFHLPSSLEELRINYCENEDVLDSLVSYFRTKASTTTTKINPRDFSLYVVNNIPLKKLDLSRNSCVSDAQWVRLINSLHNVKLEEIDLMDIEYEVDDSLVGTGSPVLAYRYKVTFVFR